jgi:AcrR family transcriptional regulator
MSPKPYHHGDLRPTLVQVALETLDERGVAGTSVREVARRAGVSHTAATYHFGDKAGLLTAVAVDGYERLGDALHAAMSDEQSFLEVGVAYVRFAVSHRSHFEVMFRPDLYHADDPALLDAKAATATLLYGTDHADAEQLSAGIAAWSIVHGLATLWLDGILPPELGDDPEEVTRLVARHLRVPHGR